MEDIARFKRPGERQDLQMSVRYIDGSGKQRVQGGRDLKASEAYPESFPDCIFEVLDFGTHSFHTSKYV